jgi:hypothetical protein
MADEISFTFLPRPLERDLRHSLSVALRSSVVTSGDGRPVAIFRQAVAEAISSLEERDDLLRRFLVQGPHDKGGPIPESRKTQRLSDVDTGQAVAFIYAHVINSFQGKLAELLSLGPCAELVDSLKRQRKLSKDVRVYAGDVVLAPRTGRGSMGKAADLHLISAITPDKVCVEGVGEVKSYHLSRPRLSKQLQRHVERARRGLMIGTHCFPPNQIVLQRAGRQHVIKIGVVPSTWHLSRNFRFRKIREREFLQTERRDPPGHDLVEYDSDPTYYITLRWSKEALAEAAYEISFWYMEKLGEHLFSGGVPSPWPKMSHADAGRNSAKLMLYYAILRATDRRSEQRAIALFNSYAFGYSLGMSFRDTHGCRRELNMLDLREILAAGHTKHNCTLWK